MFQVNSTLRPLLLYLQKLPGNRTGGPPMTLSRPFSTTTETGLIGVTSTILYYRKTYIKLLSRLSYKIP